MKTKYCLIVLMMGLYGCGGDGGSPVVAAQVPSSDSSTPVASPDVNPIATPTATPVSSVTPTPTATPTPAPTATPTPTPYAFTGSGTSGTPYQISTTTDFVHIGDHPTAYYTVTQSIDFSAAPAITPMASFSGTIYGNNYVFYNMTIQGTTEARTAIFISMSGTIVSLKLQNLTATGPNYVSSFAGTLTGSLTSCQVTGTITSPSGGNGFNTGVGTPLYVTKSGSWSASGTTMDVQFNSNRVTSLGAL